MPRVPQRQRVDQWQDGVGLADTRRVQPYQWAFGTGDRGDPVALAASDRIFLAALFPLAQYRASDRSRRLRQGSVGFEFKTRRQPWALDGAGPGTQWRLPVRWRRDQRFEC